jgi:ubiquinone/menaquinone biosynthesis C-methylase UbiE
MENQLTYEELKSKARLAWDTFSTNYFLKINRNSLSLMNTLMALTRVYQKKNIIDVGCGPGLGTRLITSDVSNIGTNIYGIDFSLEMLKYAQEVFCEYDDFNSNNKNYWDYRENTSEIINIQKDLKEVREEKVGKVVRFLHGDAENLQFEDSQFDVYIANLCLMLCVNIDRAIKESFRVLKNDGVAGFTIWGKKEESKLIWSIFVNVFEKHGIDMSKEKTSFFLANDPEVLRKRFLDAGYREVRIEYTSEIYDSYDEEDFLSKFKGPRVNSILSKIDDEIKRESIFEAIKVEARKHIVENLQLPTLNVMVILAFK